MANSIIFEFADKASLVDTDVMLLQEDSNGTAFKVTVADLRTSLLNTDITVNGNGYFNTGSATYAIRLNNNTYLGHKDTNGTYHQTIYLGGDNKYRIGSVSGGLPSNGDVTTYYDGTAKMTVNNNVIIGTDPGGSGLLRVGGSITLNGDISVNKGSGYSVLITDNIFRFNRNGPSYIDNNNGSSSTIDVRLGSVPTSVARFDQSGLSNATRFLLYDIDDSTLKRVYLGAADSGGTGYRMLRIIN